jgi:hypothetical protein
MTMRELIEEAIVEARILESARAVFDVDNMLLTAMRLSGAPYSFVESLYVNELADERLYDEA